MESPGPGKFLEVRFRLTREAFIALEAASDQLGVNRTDAANRAFLTYAQLLAAPEGPLEWTNPDGTRLTVQKMEQTGPT